MSVAEPQPRTALPQTAGLPWCRTTRRLLRLAGRWALDGAAASSGIVPAGVGQRERFLSPGCDCCG